MRKLPFVIDYLPNDDYHNSEKYLEFCKSSVLKNMIISPKYAKYCLDNPQEKDTEAISQGSVYHSMLASLANAGDLSDFNKEYFIFEPPINLKTGQPYGFATKTFQEAREAAIAENAGRLPCSESEKNVAESMIDELLNGNPHLSPQVRNLLKIGKSEQSHFVEYHCDIVER